MIKHFPVDDREDTDQLEDMVIQPDLPSMLEQDSMNEYMHDIEQLHWTNSFLLYKVLRGFTYYLKISNRMLIIGKTLCHLVKNLHI